METDIDVFLLSAVERRFAPFYQRLEAYFDGTRDGMFAMVKQADVGRFFALAERLGGARSLAMTAAEIGAANLLRIPECAFNHTTLRALKVDSSWTYLQLVMPAPLDPELVERQMARYGDEVLMHHEFARFGGKPRVSALPLIRYSDAARLDQLARELEADGCTVFNAHVFVLEDTGRKEIDARQVAFKRDADPLGLMNPGKSRTLAA
jgi:FAD/FMN-containing dehydrogenase